MPALKTVVRQNPWGLYADLHTGMHTPDLMDKYGISVTQVSVIRKRYGVAPTWNIRPEKYAKRHGKIARVIELREQDLTLQEIGDKTGVTRERVRQLLKLSDRPDLIGPRDQRENRKCPVCGCEYKSLPSNPHKTCGNRSCANEMIGRANRRDEKPLKALAMRRQGMAWCEIGRELFPNATYKTGYEGTGAAVNMVKRYAKRNNLDISWARYWTPRKKGVRRMKP